jgi:hypothetical protein
MVRKRDFLFLFITAAVISCVAIIIAPPTRRFFDGISDSVLSWMGF